MKMPESIIEKYQLVPSGEQVGESFMQNLLIYKSNTPGFEKTRFMECDLDGEPVKDIMFSVDGKAGRITPEFLESAPIDKILGLIKELTR